MALQQVSTYIVARNKFSIIYHFLKWMVMVDGCNADKMWQTLSKCLLEGKFPECIISIKINLFDDRHNGDSLEKINVITSDFTKM